MTVISCKSERIDDLIYIPLETCIILLLANYSSFVTVILLAVSNINMYSLMYIVRISNAFSYIIIDHVKCLMLVPNRIPLPLFVFFALS